MSPSLPSVTATELPEDAVLLDVREPVEWDAGHAPDAVHIPMGELPARLGELPTDRQIVAVCHVGGRSAQVTAWLVHQGYDASNLTGGMLAWAAAGRALTSETGQPPRVD
jgi:rhodanese-related sulfurtransferase